MNYARKGYISAAIMGAALISTPAFAASWNFNSVGDTAAFGWSGGLHTIGFLDNFDPASFGSPDVDVNGFHFHNSHGDMNFRAQVGADAVDQASFRVHVNTSDANPSGAGPVPFIRIRESGTWGGNQADILLQANFDVLEWDTFETTGPIDLPLITFNGDGTWTTEYTLDLTGAMAINPFWTAPFREFDLQVTNLIQVTGNNPNTFIEKRGVDVFFPEPTTLFMLMAFGPLVLRRRR